MNYEQENKLIAANRELPPAKRKHPFEAAHWTHKNGHPRCITCGDEEPVGGTCGGVEKRAVCQAAATSIAWPKGEHHSHLKSAYAWFQRLKYSNHDIAVIAEPIMRGTRHLIEIDRRGGLPQMTLDAVVHVADGQNIAYIHDALSYSGTDLRTLALGERRAFVLRSLDHLRGSELAYEFHFTPWSSVTSRSTLARAINLARDLGATGVTLKRADRPFKESVSHDDWLHIAFEQDKVPVQPTERTDTTVAKSMASIIKGEGFDEGLVTGVVMEPDVADSHGDGTRIAEIRQAAHLFMEQYRKRQTRLRFMHQDDLVDSEAILVEHYLAPQDLSIGGEFVRMGSWVQTWLVKDEVMKERIRNNEITGFSIGGLAVKEPA